MILEYNFKCCEKKWPAIRRKPLPISDWGGGSKEFYIILDMFHIRQTPVASTSDLIPQPQWYLRRWHLLGSCAEPDGISGYMDFHRRTTYISGPPSPPQQSISALSWTVQTRNRLLRLDREVLCAVNQDITIGLNWAFHAMFLSYYCKLDEPLSAAEYLTLPSVATKGLDKACEDQPLTIQRMEITKKQKVTVPYLGEILWWIGDLPNRNCSY